MERTKSNASVEQKEQGAVLWKKVGGGSFQLHGKIIKPGQTFTAFPHEIPNAFRDVIIPQEEIINDVKDGVYEKLEAVISEFSVKPRGKSKTWFDVVDKNNKVLNEKALSKEIAEKLLKDLSK